MALSFGNERLFGGELGLMLIQAKAFIQECQAAWGLLRYRVVGRRSRLHPIEKDQLREDLRTRIRGRGLPNRARSGGGLHIFLGYCRQSWEEILPLSLQPFGTVTEFEWRSRGFNDSGPDW